MSADVLAADHDAALAQAEARARAVVKAHGVLNRAWDAWADAVVAAKRNQVLAMQAEIERLQERVAKIETNGAPCGACGHIIDWQGHCACDGGAYLGINAKRREQLLRECLVEIEPPYAEEDEIVNELVARIRAELGEKL